MLTTEPATLVQTAYADVAVPLPRAEPELAAADHDPAPVAVPDTGLPAASLGKLPFRWSREGFWEPGGTCANPPPPTSVSS
ncbi:MAG TPA: hypothetical protein VKL22_00040 [Actinomycetota bacterium]|nr:hypothetical protein [Actinomycetota bacterium]